MESSNTHARSARRFLSEHLRNDFTFPSQRPSSPVDKDHGNIAEWREREYGSSDDSSDTTNAEKKSKSTSSWAYKFSSPDAVGEELQAMKDRKRRKKERRTKEEMSWNDGLALWVARRDAWTGAKKVPLEGKGEGEGATGGKDSMEPVASPDSVGDKPEPLGNSESTNTGEPKEDDTKALVPLIPPILSSNPLRQSITKAAYPEIYSKVVNFSRTPQVPINLADMTRAIVKGWQDSDEWPPKMGPLDPLAGRRRVITTKTTVTGGKYGARIEKSPSKEDSGQFFANHPHVKRGMESMKRVFRLSGSHSTPPPDHPDNA